MFIVKTTILMWFLYVIIRYFVKLNISDIEKLNWIINKNLKWTFGRVVVVFLFLINIILTIISLIWFLFISGMI